MIIADLAGGLNPEVEYFLHQKPDDPQMRDSATLWVMDDSGTLAFPRITIDAIGEDWEHPWLQLNLVHRDGRAFRLWSGEHKHAPLGADGKPSVPGAGPLRFECLEPFRRWRIGFDGKVGQVRGNVRIGPEEYRISGTGMRVRRQGVRNMSLATGHCQHSALFPCGRAFGAIAFAPAADGSQSFNEGSVLTGDGSRVPARVAEAPWMTRLNASGEEASLVLETAIGTIRIEAKTLLSTFDHHLFEMADTSVLHQGVARYVWDGEETIGLIERCTLRSRLR